MRSVEYEEKEHLVPLNPPARTPNARPDPVGALRGQRFRPALPSLGIAYSNRLSAVEPSHES